MIGALKKSAGFTVAGLLIAGFLTAATGCEQKQEAKKVSLEKRELLKTEETSRGNALRIAIGAMITPKEGFAYYKHLLDYLGEKLQRPVKLVDRGNYAEINSLLNAGNLDAAFVCSGPYVEGRDEFGLELSAVPQAHGETVYYSYIIVHKDSPVKTFEGLKGKVFAFTDPKSNTGKLVPTYMLARMDETPDSFFAGYTFTYAHDKSIKAVALRVVDGAAVDSLVWEYKAITDPGLTSRTRVIMKSPPYGIPPFVVRPGLDSKTKKRLKEILLAAHRDEKGKEILKGMMINRFVEGDDSAYDSVRRMKDWIAKQEGRE